MSDLYNDDKLMVMGGDDNKPDSPSERYGIWLGVAVFVGIIFFGMFMTVSVMYCNKLQEQSKRNRNKGTSHQPYSAS